MVSLICRIKKNQTHRNKTIEWWLPGAVVGENKGSLVKGYKLSVMSEVWASNV